MTYDVLYRIRDDESVDYYPQTEAAHQFLKHFIKQGNCYPFREAPDFAWFAEAGLTLGPIE